MAHGVPCGERLEGGWSSNRGCVCVYVVPLQAVKFMQNSSVGNEDLAKYV